MEISIKLEQVLPMQSGVSKAGNNWKKLVFIGSTLLDQYPKKIAFTLFNGGVDNYAPLLVDSASLTVSFDLESRPFVGNDGVERWSTEVKAWKVAEYEVTQTSFAPQNAAQPQQAVVQQAQPVADEVLPF